MRHTVSMLVVGFMLALLSACAQRPAAATTPIIAPVIDHAALQAQVLAAERAFAATMAARDHAAFTRFLADDAIFLSPQGALRGKAAVAEGWRAFFSGAHAPFSWQPDQVEVQAGGALALSTGPVYDPSGKPVARFTSIWQQQAPGVWKIVFDRGNPQCPPPTTP
ncbi:MAG TPA: nuclear transport factor 2 family protein [Permianibacter sp.]|nr:nuclear transport factor 2 family protein [Permianibacter sp.]